MMRSNRRRKASLRRFHRSCGVRGGLRRGNFRMVQALALSHLTGQGWTSLSGKIRACILMPVCVFHEPRLRPTKRLRCRDVRLWRAHAARQEEMLGTGSAQRLGRAYDNSAEGCQSPSAVGDRWIVAYVFAFVGRSFCERGEKNK